jgi:hypothetical protein
MTTICIRPIPIYNTQNRKRSIIRPISTNTEPELRKLREQVEKYKNAQKKIKTLTEWNLRSTKSSLKDVQDILETLEDLYGDDAFKD